MGKTYKWAVLAAVCIMVSACAVTGEARQVVDQLLADQTITPEQHAAIVGGGSAWLDWLIYVGSSVVAAYTGIRITRGPPTRAENVEKKQAREAAAP